MKRFKEPGIEMQDLGQPPMPEGLIPSVVVSDNQQQKRFAGLIDIDHTLADTGENGKVKLNRNLLEALKAKGIKDLYLFTDMMLLPYQIKDRLHIIKKLKKRGFSVLGVITPIDYFWTSDPTMLVVLEKFDEAIRKARISFKKGAATNLNLLPEVLAQFPEIKEKINSDPDVGGAFKEGAESYLKEDNINPLTERSIHCKNAIDVVSYLRGFETCKGVMCQQFLAHLPEWVSACFVFEDNQDHRAAVAQCLSPNVALFIVAGQFTVKGGDTFVENFAPYLKNTSYVQDELPSRMIKIASLALLHVANLQQTATLGGLRYKREVAEAESLLKKVVGCAEDFKEQWRCVADHFRSLPKSFSGAYQLSVFEIQLLELLADDAAICNKVDAVNNNQARPVIFDLTQKSGRQLFIQRLLGNAVPTKVQGPINPLHQSMGSLPTVRSSRASKATFEFAKKKTSSAETANTLNPDLIRVGTRGRSQSDGPVPEPRILNPSPKDSTDADDLADTFQQGNGM